MSLVSLIVSESHTRNRRNTTRMAAIFKGEHDASSTVPGAGQWIRTVWILRHSIASLRWASHKQAAWCNTIAFATALEELLWLYGRWISDRTEDRAAASRAAISRSPA
eukprot:g8865.t1